jgi:SAM-dependent methyltransferase
MNDDQKAYWNGPAGQRWISQQETLDRALTPFGRAVVEAAGVRAGERVLDVGCGCGDTSLALARLVQPGGSVTGVDLSAAMLGRARERSVDLESVRFIEADASAFPPEQPVDCIVSRFGVMFFEDPQAAFSHLRGLLRRGGRLAFVCWRAYEENPWCKLPMDVVQSYLPEAVIPGIDGSPGPFAFADRRRVEGILRDSGFEGVSLEPFDADVCLSPGDLDEAVQFALQAGPAARTLADAPQLVIEGVRRDLRDQLSQYGGAQGYQLPGATWIARAAAR